jgi:hypothetical protein
MVTRPGRKRIQEDGPNPLVQMPRPVNRFPDFVRHVVQRFKLLCPSLGKRKIAQILARAGLHLGSTTVQRMVKEDGLLKCNELQPNTRSQHTSD